MIFFMILQCLLEGNSLKLISLNSASLHNLLLVVVQAAKLAYRLLLLVHLIILANNNKLKMIFMIYKLLLDGTSHSANNSPPLPLSAPALSLFLAFFLRNEPGNTSAGEPGKPLVVFEGLLEANLLSMILLAEKPFAALFIVLCPRVLETKNPYLLLICSHLATTPSLVFPLLLKFCLFDLFRCFLGITGNLCTIQP